MTEELRKKALAIIESEGYVSHWTSRSIYTMAELLGLGVGVARKLLDGLYKEGLIERKITKKSTLITPQGRVVRNYHSYNASLARVREV